jgi:outer membrane protein assembly factor BamB
VNNVIYVSAGTRVFALDQATGNEKWKFPTTQEVQGGYFRKTPVMADGVVVVSNERWLYGIDPANGQQLWAYHLVDPSQGITGPCVGAGKFVICVLNGEYLLAINGKDGKETWNAPLHIFDLLKGDMIAYEDTLFYFTQKNALCSINVNDPSKVKTLGQFSTLSEDAVPTLRGGTLFINTGSYLSAFNAVTGSLRWQVDTQDDLVYGPAASSEGEAVINRDGVLTIVDLNGHIKTMKTPNGKGVQQMKIDLQSGPAAAPSEAGSLFAVPTLNGNLNLIDPKDGSIVWRYMVHPMNLAEATKLNSANRAHQVEGSSGLDRPDPASFAVQAAGPATVIGDTLLLLADDGSLLSFDKSTGVDVTGPEVRMVTPRPGSEVSSQDLAVAFSIADDASGVNDSTVTLMANGKPVTQEFTADGLDIARFTLRGGNGLLQDGRVEFVLTVSDWLGNATTAHFSITINNDLPPVFAPLPKTGPSGGGKFGGKFGGGGGGGGGGSTDSGDGG